MGESAVPEEVNLFTHTYYQGLITEIGNLQGYKTFVPSQDRNKPFLSTRLSKMITLTNFYPFTYEHLVKHASTIDVVWFNERRMPNAMFEVEHTTDMRTALLKFLEFQDFRVKFKIVADVARYNEFQSKIQFEAFKPIRDQVQFINYDKLVEYYERVSASVALGKELQL